jgi:hypothetical protein
MSAGRTTSFSTRTVSVTRSGRREEEPALWVRHQAPRVGQPHKLAGASVHERQAFCVKGSALLASGATSVSMLRFWRYNEAQRETSSRSLSEHRQYTCLYSTAPSSGIAVGIRPAPRASKASAATRSGGLGEYSSALSGGTHPTKMPAGGRTNHVCQLKATMWGDQPVCEGGAAGVNCWRRGQHDGSMERVLTTSPTFTPSGSAAHPVWLLVRVSGRESSS